MSNPLMDFRLRYLRAIAESWKDTDYEKELIEAPDLLSHFEKRDEEKLKKFISPWDNVLITFLSQQENPVDPGEWEPDITAGWVGPNDSFVVILPENPWDFQSVKQSKAGSPTIAIAKYYEAFPTIFGINTNHSLSSAPPPPAGGALPTDLGASDGPFLEFGGVTLRALALAWADKDFYKELITLAPPDATPVLSKYLGYNNPWNFNIKFEMANFEWCGNDWGNFPKNRVELHYPEKPDISEKHLPIALTSYNNTGPAYPFSCA